MALENTPKNPLDAYLESIGADPSDWRKAVAYEQALWTELTRLNRWEYREREKNQDKLRASAGTVSDVTTFQTRLAEIIEEKAKAQAEILARVAKNNRKLLEAKARLGFAIAAHQREIDEE